MTTNRAEKRATEAMLVRKAKKIRKSTAAKEETVVLLTLLMDEEIENEETGEIEVKETPVHISIPKKVSERDTLKLLRTFRKMGEEAMIDHLLENLLGEAQYDFILDNTDDETFQLVAKKAVQHVFGLSPDADESKKEDETAKGN